MNACASLEAALIGLDWGTTSLRALRYGADGGVLERRHSAHGITQLPAAGEAGFARALVDIAGDWLCAAPQAPVLACGMVGSAQGWREAAYVQIPASLQQLSGLCTMVPLTALDAVLETDLFAQRTLLILPGLIERGPAPALPNVMRGEETQIWGCLQAPDAPQELVVVLPGSHSKWVEVRAQCIQHFDTFMTGEVFAALRAHTILGRTMAESTQFERNAFVRGVEVACGAQGANGVLSTIFSTRTLGLEGQLAAHEQPDFLSGLLIGHEVVAASQQLRARANGREWPFWLVGAEALCTRYLLAMQVVGMQHCRMLPQATEQGLWTWAQLRGLVAAPLVA